MKNKGFSEKVCSANVSEALDIIYAKKTCRNPIVALFGRLNLVEFLDDATDFDFFDNYIETYFDEGYRFANTIARTVFTEKSIPIVLIVCGFLFLFDTTRKFVVFLIYGSAVAAAIAVDVLYTKVFYLR